VGWADFYKSKPATTISGIFYDRTIDDATKQQKGYSNFPEDFPDKACLQQHPTRTTRRAPTTGSGCTPIATVYGYISTCTRISTARVSASG